MRSREIASRAHIIRMRSREIASRAHIIRMRSREVASRAHVPLSVERHRVEHIPLAQLIVDLDHSPIEDGVPPDEARNQTSSDVIRGHQRSSEVIEDRVPPTQEELRS